MRMLLFLCILALVPIKEDTVENQTNFVQYVGLGFDRAPNGVNRNINLKLIVWYSKYNTVNYDCKMG